jgi:hypothetical protein
MSIYTRQVVAQHARHFGTSYVEIRRKMIELSSKIDVYPYTWGGVGEATTKVKVGLDSPYVTSYWSSIESNSIAHTVCAKSML